MVNRQGPTCELRSERTYAIAQVITPGGVAAFSANLPPEFVRSVVLAAHAEWKRANRGV